MGTLAVVVCIAVLMLTFGMPTGVRATTSGSTHLLSAKPAFDGPPVFLGRSLPAGEPSPYCPTAQTIGGPIGTGVICYTPQDLKVAYNYPSYLTGAGQTIVVIGVFGSPTVQSDLNVFDQQFGLPATTIQVVCQNGAATCPNPMSNGDEVGWTYEIALDTQWAHAMAPGAHIVLFVAMGDDDLTLVQAVSAAVTMFPHSIITQSFGIDVDLCLIDGNCYDPTYVQQVLTTGEAAYQLAAQEGTTVFAAAGNWGADLAPFGLASFGPEGIYPADSPWVTAVGGTMGNPYYLGSIPSCGTSRVCSTGLVTFRNTPSCQLNSPTPTATATCIPVGYGGEQVWNEPWLGVATGGAPSLLFGVPSYQAGLGLTARTIPDVSYNTAVSGGGIIYWGAIPSEAGFLVVGGTSMGSPQWAAIAALADQLAAILHLGPIGFINPALYFIGSHPWLYRLAFHDVTVGNNLVAGGLVGFSATPGWDDATGWGTPNVANLVPLLALLSQ